MTTFAVLLEAARLGLALSCDGDRLRVLPARLCPPDFAETMRQHKPALLQLLRMRFLIVESAVLGEIVCFAADEETKTSLLEAGAEEGCVYTRLELCTLVELHRREPITAADLLRIHEAKRIFSGRIAPTQGTPYE